MQKPVNKPNFEGLKKFIMPVIGIIFALASILVLAQVVMGTKEGPDPVVKKEENSGEAIKATDLRLKTVEAKLNEIEKNIKKIYSNQLKLNESISALIDTDENLKKTQKENRAYVAMIYQRLLDTELQISNLGGGFNMKPRPKEEPINPLIGTDELPQVPPRLE
jgi:septal ring factor EnvC (AmiA/AmiB activator)